MIKYIFILLFSTNLFAQNGLVYYGFIDAKGMGNAKGPDSNAYLVFNKEQSYFVTAKDSLESKVSKTETKTFKNEGESGGLTIMGNKVSPQGDQVAYHIKKNTMWSNVLLGNQIYTKEVAPDMNWKISKEIKKIGKFNCKKATSNFRGRIYTAWFTSDIPLPYGPWKLHGLPGLILEAYDTDKNLYWYFKSVEYPSKTKEKAKYMSIPKDNKWLNYTEFQKEQQDILEKAMEKNKIMAKKYPGFKISDPDIELMFIEFK
ncbi:GLPGLI family protein [Flavobacterium qiangtangense]|uniref:GLPGLI family protein n=1 Tax=Flavobacterium qiangtangense TaxID=1442595 RepID=A0ABW1PQD7_9FLAO